MDRELLQAIVRELDQAVYNHNRWYQEIIRSIVCRLPHDKRELAEDSHRQCPFGQWYYSFYSKELQKNPTFQSIETEHKKMHRMAAKLLSSSANQETISPIDYDDFASVVERLRINIQSLKYELEETLYNRDPLTGTRNRVGMLNDLREQLELVHRQLQSSSIALMDLDRFKEINDTYGHLVGDKVLVNISAYMTSHVRPYDRIYRYGGEEFLICMPHTDLDTAVMIIERLRDGLSSLQTNDDNVSLPIIVSASFGVTMLSPDATVEQAIDRADRALYRSKSAGRDRVTTWENGMEVPTTGA